MLCRSHGRLRLIGQTNLMIESAQLSDDSEYSCVLEKPALLVASAKLTVLGKLTSAINV